MDRNTTVMVETFLPGKKISLNYSELEELYAKSFEWLKIFFKATKKDTIKFSTLKSNSNSENTIAELGLQNELIGKLKTIFEKSRKFENTILPFSASQGDFDFDNIFLNEDSINIADWEDYKEKGEIFIDVDFFVFNTALYFYQTKNHIESFKKFFSSDSQTYKLADYYIADYCKFLGVDKKLFYIVSIFNTIDILKNGYRRHPRVPMQNADFLHALADLTIREITHEQ